MRARRLSPALGLALLAALLVAAFLALFELRESTVRTGWSAAARRDSLLAARRFLTEMGVPATAGHSFKDLPPPGHLLVAQRDFSKREAQHVLRWVEEGGYLLAYGDFFLRAELGIDLSLEIDYDDRVEAPGEEPSPDEEPAAEKPEATRLLLGAEEQYEVDLRTTERFDVAESQPELAALLAGETDSVLLRFRRGKGWVVVFVDLGAFGNLRLGDLEHASLLWSLASVDGAPRGAVLVAGFGDYPPFGSLLWRHGWRVLTAGALLLAFWLWRRAARFGPLLPDPPRARRSLVEHIRASAEFLRRRGEAGSLVESARQALLKRAAQRFPGFARLPSRAKVEKLAALAELPGETVSWALGGPVPRRPHDLMRMIQALETLRRPL